VTLPCHNLWCVGHLGVQVMTEDARLEYDLEGLWAANQPEAVKEDDSAQEEDIVLSTDFEWDERPVRKRISG